MTACVALYTKSWLLIRNCNSRAATTHLDCSCADNCSHGLTLLVVETLVSSHSTMSASEFESHSVSAMPLASE